MDDVSWMRRALDLANMARDAGEVPVGALVIDDNRVIAQAYNLRETLHDPSGHAERVALELAGRSRGSWRLDGCTLYVTLEPCAMCAGAIVLSRISRVVYACLDSKAGACQSLYHLLEDPRLNHRVEQTSGVLGDEASVMLSGFFQAKRKSRV